MIYGLTSHGLDCIFCVIKYIRDLTLRKLNWELSFSVLHLDYWYTCYHVNARIMKFIPNEIRIMFSRVSSIIRVLDNDLENFNV